MIHYGSSTQSDHNSGAYLFLPNGDAKEIPMGERDIVRIQRGSFLSRVDILHEVYGLQYKLTNTNGLLNEKRERERNVLLLIFFRYG